MGEAPKTFEELTADMPDFESTALAGAEPCFTPEDGERIDEAIRIARGDVDALAERDARIRAEERAACVAKLRDLEAQARRDKKADPAAGVSAIYHRGRLTGIKGAIEAMDLNMDDPRWTGHGVADMTRHEFVRKATRAAERALEIPSGWWGTWRMVYGPRGGITVSHRRGGRWVVRKNGELVGVYDSRAYAIKQARKAICG